MAMTRTREMEQTPDPREVERVLFRLEKPARTEYSVEIEARALALLQTRAHNEWKARLDAEAEARYLRTWNTRLTWVVMVLAMVLVVEGRVLR